MAYRIPASFVTGMATVALQRGIDLPRLLVESGLSPINARTRDFRVSERQVTRLAAIARRLTGDDLFGLGNAPMPRGTLRILSYAMANVSTLHEAIERMATLVEPLESFPSLSLESRGEHSALSIAIERDDSPDHVLTVLVMAMTDRIISWAIGRTTPKVRVEFPFPKPSNSADVSLLLGEHIRYGIAGSPALVLPTSVLDTRIRHDEQAVLDYVARAPGEWLAAEPDPLPLARRVRRLIERDLARQHIATADELAAALLTSVPTLRRQLREEGSSLRQIRDEVLAKTAQTALRTSDEPIATIAARLRFSETSAFTRAFHRWTGEAPIRYRARHRAA